ncbi:unnamed protein product [Callosobruchus maculatus]|uniref:Uncharacterized protein n=1 Tax=Callosobruchus maculatus TaxID=64391 RepID=A0A653C3N8_CALMS|nr:unnamed protein product [Callosobruchus maculatus]
MPCSKLCDENVGSSTSDQAEGRALQTDFAFKKNLLTRTQCRATIEQYREPLAEKGNLIEIFILYTITSIAKAQNEEGSSPDTEGGVTSISQIQWSTYNIIALGTAIFVVGTGSEHAGHQEKTPPDDADGPTTIILEDEAIELHTNMRMDTNSEEAIKKAANTYAAKKTIAQGMMDIALITANANQLRYVLEYTRHTSTFYVLVFLITISLVLQVAIGCALIFKGRLDIKGESKGQRAQIINNCVVSSVFLVTIINVFIASFTITGNSMSKK